MQTYTREIHANIDFVDEIHYALFSVSKADLFRWQKLLKLGQEHDVAYLESFDYRCDFLDEDQEEVAFGEDASRAVVMVSQQAIKFTGYERHCGPETEWSTEPLKLSDIAEDLRVSYGEQS